MAFRVWRAATIGRFCTWDGFVFVFVAFHGIRTALSVTCRCRGVRFVFIDGACGDGKARVCVFVGVLRAVAAKSVLGLGMGYAFSTTRFAIEIVAFQKVFLCVVPRLRAAITQPYNAQQRDHCSKTHVVHRPFSSGVYAFSAQVRLVYVPKAF